jgi:hypothetical protein
MATKEGGGYGSALGSKFTRIWSYLVKGPLSNPGLIGTTGPVTQNGGDVILEAGMFCALWSEGYRLQEQADHCRWDLLVLPQDGAYRRPYGSSRSSQSGWIQIIPYSMNVLYQPADSFLLRWAIILYMLLPFTVPPPMTVICDCSTQPTFYTQSSHPYHHVLPIRLE